MARKKYRPWLRDPAWLFPPTTHEGLGEEHLVFFAMDTVSDSTSSPSSAPSTGRTRAGSSPTSKSAWTSGPLRATQAAREAYRARAQTIEPVFGQIKECTGFRQFSFRGLAAVAAEWKLVCLAQNIRKARRFTQIQPA